MSILCILSYIPFVIPFTFLLTFLLIFIVLINFGNDRWLPIGSRSKDFCCGLGVLLLFINRNRVDDIKDVHDDCCMVVFVLICGTCQDGHFGVIVTTAFGKVEPDVVVFHLLKHAI